MTDSLTRELTTTLTPAIEQSMREGLVAPICEKVVAKATTQLDVVVKSTENLRSDWRALLESNDAKNLKAFVRAHIVSLFELLQLPIFL